MSARLLDPDSTINDDRVPLERFPGLVDELVDRLLELRGLLLGPAIPSQLLVVGRSPRGFLHTALRSSGMERYGMGDLALVMQERQ